MGFACLAQSIYGKSLVEFSTFSISFSSIFLMTIGHVNLNRMMNVDADLTIPFLIFFYMIVCFFLLSLFLGIFIDNYRLVILEVGFQYENEKSWTIKGMQILII